MKELCSFYWNNSVAHYFFFPVVGPALAFLISYFCLKYSFKIPFALFVNVFILGVFAFIFRASHFGCQMALFGRVNDEPGDIGIVFLSLPTFVVLAVVGLVSVFIVSKKKLAERRT